jgi:hypothetical protein
MGETRPVPKPSPPAGNGTLSHVMGHAKFSHQSFPPRRLGDQPIIASDTAARVVRHEESLLSEIPVVWGGVMVGEVQGEL